MAEDDLTLRMRAQGARQSAREVDKVTGSVKKYEGAAKGAHKSSIKARAGVRTFGGALKPIASVAAGGAAALGVVGLAGAAKSFVDEFRDSQKVTKQTNAVLKSTHGAANVTAKSVGNLSTAISNKTGIDDEAIQSGNNMLLTFTNIRNHTGKNNKIFNQASRTMVDMGAAMHKGPGAASIMLGKALNDPTKGMAALRRVGVTFTKGQQDQVAAMQKSGNMMGAQRLILGELNKEFGGSAAAQADPIDKAKVAWGNLQEMLGGYLWPVVTKVTTAFGKFVTGIQDGTGAGGAFAGKVKAVVGQIKIFVAQWKSGEGVGGRFRSIIMGVAHGIQSVVTWLTASSTHWMPFAIGIGAAAVAAGLYGAAMGIAAAATGIVISPVLLVVAGIALLAAGFTYAYQHSETFRNGLNAVWGAIKSLAAGAPGALRGAFEGVINWVIGRLNSAIDLINVAIGIYNKIPGHGDVGKIGHIGNVGGPDIVGANTKAGKGATAATQAATGHAARGGVIQRSGSYEVGERGREVVHLPAGATVEPHSGLGELVVPVTLVTPHGDVLARTTARAVRKKKAVQ